MLSEQLPADQEELQRLRDDPAITVLDHRDAQRAELQRVLPVPETALLYHPGGWAYYPWRRAVVGILGATAFRLLRLDRNRNKITRSEQDRLGRLRVGVVGLSVGLAIAHSLALEGLCGELRLADFDTLDLSNLNRIPATVFDLGVNKAVIAARRIAELDPYLPVSVVPAGLSPDTMAGFLDGLDVVIEECDSLDTKVLLREQARARGIPVLMETSDRGLLDVERFDLDPDRPIFHGLLGQDFDATSLAGLTMRERVPYLFRLLDASALSSRMAASMVEVGRTITTWPQLGGDVTLGAATVTAAVRRLGLGEPLPSGRIRIDLGEQLDTLRDPVPPATPGHPPVAPVAECATTTMQAVLLAVRAAPSGGNIQPWSVSATRDSISIHLVPERTTAMDVEHRGSYVAIGAALYNARVAAAAAQALGPVELFPRGPGATLVGVLHLGDQTDRHLSRHDKVMMRRHTNRRLGRPRSISATISSELQAAAGREGGALCLVTDRERLHALGALLAAADRIRYLTPTLHAEMMAELRWPGQDSLEAGIDVRTLELDEASLATLAVARRPDVMALLAKWEQGAALGADTEERVASSSALALVTVPGCSAEDFVRGGSAAEAVWVCAQAHQLAVQPISPVFLYALNPAELAKLSPPYVTEVAELQSSLRASAGIGDGQSIALILRVSHASDA
ncbi:MAG: Rv1355c family protein, partial [Mycobacteriaceae bacterium]